MDANKGPCQTDGRDREGAKCEAIRTVLDFANGSGFTSYYLNHMDFHDCCINIMSVLILSIRLLIRRVYHFFLLRVCVRVVFPCARPHKFTNLAVVILIIPLLIYLLLSAHWLLPCLLMQLYSVSLIPNHFYS